MPDIAFRRRQLQHRVVRIHGHRQRMNAPHQHLAVQSLRSDNHGPFALRKAQCHELLKHVLLLRADVQAMLHGCFGMLDLLVIRQHARDLLQRRRGMRNGSPGDRQRPVDGRTPQLDRLARGARPFEEPAQIDVGGNEIGVDGDRLIESVDRGFGVAGLTVQGRAIEMRHIEQRMLAVAVDPSFVKLPRRIDLARRRQFAGGVDQLRQRERPGRDLLQCRQI